MNRPVTLHLVSLFAVAAFALLGPGSSPSAAAQLRSLAALSILASSVTPTSYTVTDLGTLGGSYTVPGAINASGQVVGTSLTTADAAVHAFLWANGKMQDLDTLGGTNSFATNLNAAGQVVG